MKGKNHVEKRIVEINGVRLEVDLSTARVVENYKIGDKVKVLIKKYNSYQSYPGVIIGFDPFEKLPTIAIAYLVVEYTSATLSFVYLNSSTEDSEICPALDGELLLEKSHVIELMDREIAKAEYSVSDLQAKKTYLLERFGQYFRD